MTLRGQKVLARCDAAGQLSHEAGRVEVRYRPDDGRAYRALVANLEPLGSPVLPDDHCGPGAVPPPKAEGAKGAKAQGASRSAPARGAARSMPRKHEARDHLREPEDGTVLVYADGACTGNPGPAGLGVVVFEDGHRRELSEYLGMGTNNIAELTAILRAAELFADDARHVELRTDSQYAIGVLSKGWKAKANVELVARVKKALTALSGRLKLVYVPGHSGVDGNERADALARQAIERRGNKGWQKV